MYKTNISHEKYITTFDQQMNNFIDNRMSAEKQKTKLLKINICVDICICFKSRHKNKGKSSVK